MMPIQTDANRLLNYLPDIYDDADDPIKFLKGILDVIDSFWIPMESQIDQLYAYFDPGLTPEDLLPWLGSWVDLVLDENWPIERRRRLIRRAAELYAMRGTAIGLKEYLTIFLGPKSNIEIIVDEEIPYHFFVLANVPDSKKINLFRLKQIINEEKPAHTKYTLHLEDPNE